jgi:hypothetical protein
MQRVKNQHYVSQYCLCRFTMDGTRTWVFDKPTKRSFPRNVDEIASEERFYENRQRREKRRGEQSVRLKRRTEVNSGRRVRQTDRSVSSGWRI